MTRSRAALNGRDSSQIISGLAPGARVVKAISNMPALWIQDFSPDKPRTVLFVSGNDVEAKQIVSDLIDDIGFAAIDLGSLDNAAAVVQVGGPLSGVHMHYVQRLRPPPPLAASEATS